MINFITSNVLNYDKKNKIQNIKIKWVLPFFWGNFVFFWTFDGGFLVVLVHFVVVVFFAEKEKVLSETYRMQI